MEQQNKNFKLVSNKKTRVILPNMFTLIGVCIGLSSIKFAFDAKFTLSIIAIIVAAIIDGLDGRIARLIQGTSKVGKELDSLTDVISFGVAPAFIMYFWKLNELGRIGWLICLIYVVCVALRLARFNVNSGKEPSWRDNFFEGVPSPAGGVLVLMPLIYSLSDIQIINVNYDFFVPILFVIISILLISKAPTYALKKISVPRNMTIFLLLAVVSYFGLLLIYTFNAIVISGLIYFIMIPISFIHYTKLSKNFKDQNTSSENGIYVVGSSPARAVDLAAGSDAAGMFTFIEQGTVNADNGFVCTSNKGSAVTGTNNLTFAQFSGAGQITTADGLQKSGNTISVDLKANGGLVIESAEIALDLAASSITGTLPVTKLTSLTSTVTELNVLDGMTATTTELNLMDGGTSATSTTLAAADRFVCNDAGTMKQVALSDLVTFLENESVSGFNIDGGSY